MNKLESVWQLNREEKQRTQKKKCQASFLFEGTHFFPLRFCFFAKLSMFIYLIFMHMYLQVFFFYWQTTFVVACLLALAIENVYGSVTTPLFLFILFVHNYYLLPLFIQKRKKKILCLLSVALLKRRSLSQCARPAERQANDI